MIRTFARELELSTFQDLSLLRPCTISAGLHCTTSRLPPSAQTDGAAALETHMSVWRWLYPVHGTVKRSFPVHSYDFAAPKPYLIAIVYQS